MDYISTREPEADYGIIVHLPDRMPVRNDRLDEAQRWLKNVWQARDDVIELGLSIDQFDYDLITEFDKLCDFFEELHSIRYDQEQARYRRHWSDDPQHYKMKG